jgi:hypothetical protein
MTDYPSFPVSEAPHINELRIQMFGKQYVLHPMEDLKFNKSDLGEQMQAQPAMYAFYASLRDLAGGKHQASIAARQEHESQFCSKCRSQGFLPGQIKITEDGLKQAVRNDEYYQTLNADVIAVEQEYNILSSIVQAFEHRRQMISSLASRASNSAFNDSDVSVCVTGKITDIKKELKGRGMFPETHK